MKQNRELRIYWSMYRDSVSAYVLNVNEIADLVLLLKLLRKCLEF